RQFWHLGGVWINAMPLVSIHDQIRDARTEDAFAPLHGLHRGRKILSPVGFKDPTANPRFQAVPDHLLGFHRGEDQDCLRGVVLQDLTRRVETVQYGKANIQNQEIWFQLPALFDRIPSVSGFATDLPTFVRPKQRRQTEAKYWMIVSHQNAVCAHRTSPNTQATLSSSNVMRLSTIAQVATASRGRLETHSCRLCEVGT